MGSRVQCDQHSGHEARITTLENSKVEMMQSNISAHKRIDKMQIIAIVTMSSALLQLAVMILGVVLVKNGLPPK